MKRPGKALGVLTPFCFLAVAVAIGHLAAQDSAEEVCRHRGGRVLARVDPEKMIQAYKRSIRLGPFKTREGTRERGWPKGKPLPSCRFGQEKEKELPAGRLAASILFADEKTFRRGKRHLKRGDWVLFVAPRNLKKAARLAQEVGARWGIAPPEYLELLKITCLPVLVSPVKRGKGKVRVRALSGG